MKKLLIIFTLLSSFIMNQPGANESDEFQGFKIELDENLYQQKQEIHIRGLFSVFVNCGSQYAIWGQFPQVIRYKLKDLDSGVTYHSLDRELSISWEGNSVYEDYAQKPCNKVVAENFSENIQEIYFENPPKSPIRNYLIQAEYMNFVSESIKVENKPIKLNTL